MMKNAQGIIRLRSSKNNDEEEYDNQSQSQMTQD